MPKSCKEIGEEIQSLKRDLQQSRMYNYYVKSLIDSEKLDHETTLENKEKDRNSSRNETGANQRVVIPSTNK